MTPAERKAHTAAINKRRNSAIKQACIDAGYTSASNFWTCVISGEVELPVKEVKS